MEWLAPSIWRHMSLREAGDMHWQRPLAFQQLDQHLSYASLLSFNAAVRTWRVSAILDLCLVEVVAK